MQMKEMKKKENMKKMKIMNKRGHIGKKGIATLDVIQYIFWFAFAIIFLGVFIWGFGLIYDALDVNVDIGQVNLQDVNNQTFGRMNLALMDHGDTIGLAILLSMCLLMFFSAYFFGSDNSKMWIPVDIVIIVFAFIVAVYVSQTFETLINLPILDVFQNELPKSSGFILNLPLIVSTLGVIIMIISYIGLKRENEEGVNVLGY